MIKSNTTYTAGELLKLAKLDVKKIGKYSASISGIKGITDPNHLIKIVGDLDVDISINGKGAILTIDGAEDNHVISKAAAKLK